MIGHNSIEGKALTAFVARIERLEEEKKTIAADIKEVYAEVKAGGLNPRTLRKVIALRKKDAAARAEEEAEIETYLSALGMLTGAIATAAERRSNI